MTSALRLLWQRNRWLVVGFALVLTVTVAFAVRAAMFAIWWHDPAHRDQPIEAWMTPRYVAMSWDAPRDVIEAAVGRTEGPRDGMPPSLSEIAAERGIGVDELIAEIEAAIMAHRAAAPPPDGRP